VDATAIIIIAVDETVIDRANLTQGAKEVVNAEMIATVVMRHKVGRLVKKHHYLMLMAHHVRHKQLAMPQMTAKKGSANRYNALLPPNPYRLQCLVTKALKAVVIVAIIAAVAIIHGQAPTGQTIVIITPVVPAKVLVKVLAQVVVLAKVLAQVVVPAKALAQVAVLAKVSAQVVVVLVLLEQTNRERFLKKILRTKSVKPWPVWGQVRAANAKKCVVANATICANALNKQNWQMTKQVSSTLRSLYRFPILRPCLM
jgi:hypothetical protein